MGKLVTSIKKKLLIANWMRTFFFSELTILWTNQPNSLLPFLTKQQTSTSTILKVRNEKGKMVYGVEEILTCFYKYYVTMYMSSLNCAEIEIDVYLQHPELPKIT